MNDILKAIDSIQIKSNSVIVYDIDGTLIDQQGRPILPIIYTYNYAKEKGLKPVIITARKSWQDNINKTIEQLKTYNITGHLRIYFLPEENNDQAMFKFLSRKHLYESGYQVEMSIGDMPWDIGLYGGIGFIV